MAVSLNSYLPRLQDLTCHLSTGETVSIKINEEVFHGNGQLKGEARFSAERDIQLFTLHWPNVAASNFSTLSTWRLMITKATDDRIASFCSGTADTLGQEQWKVVKDVVEACRSKFQARLLSMSCREVVFGHADQQQAERMKQSNEMVDIMNKLLADVDFLFLDIMVDWEVKVRPVMVALPAQPDDSEDEQLSPLTSLLLTDADSPPVGKSTESKYSESQDTEIPPVCQKLFYRLAEENRKMQEALHEMSKENAHRHRIVCQKIEELRNVLKHLNPDSLRHEEASETEGETESDANAECAVTPPSHRQHQHATTSSTGLQKQQQLQQQKEQQSPQQASGSHRQQQKEQQSQQQASGSHRQRQNVRNRSHRSSSPKSEKMAEEVLRKDSSKPSDSFRDTFNTDAERKSLDEAVERAYLHDEIPAPKAKSYYTILCLDTSASMEKHDAFSHMKMFVEQFINGVEDIVNETSVEENIGVVTFGGTSTVVQNLTNDFCRVREAVDNIQLGGRSPFVQALLVSMAAFVEKSGIISVGGHYHVYPRIIFVSDGYPTENYDDKKGVDQAYDKSHVRTNLTRLMMNFASKEQYRKIQPVIYVPVGTNPDRELLKSMATLSQGQYRETSDVQELCSYFMMEETVGKTLSCLRGSDERETGQDQIKTLASALMPSMNEEQTEKVMDKVIKELENPTKKYGSRNRKRDMEDRYENTDKVNAGEMLPLGTRVTRGPDWEWGDQDSNGPGTVFSHTDKKGWTWVLWDESNHYNRYPFGPDMGYGIWKTDKHPRLWDSDRSLKIGMTVEKGPGWCYGDQRNKQYGVVVRQSKSEDKLMVRWNNGELQVVRWGAEGQYDVKYCDPRNIPKESPLEFLCAGDAWQLQKTDDAPTYGNFNTLRQGADTMDIAHGKWQWKDGDGDWHDYLPEENAKIEKSFKRKPEGTCIVHREDKNRRIMFRRFTEKDIDSGAECDVRRIPA